MRDVIAHLEQQYREDYYDGCDPIAAGIACLRRERRRIREAEPYLADYPLDDPTTIAIHEQLGILDWQIAVCHRYLKK